MYNKKLVSSVCLLLLTCGSCTVKPPEITITGEKTVLEQQLLGQYRLSPKEIFMPTAGGGIYTRFEARVLDSIPGGDSLSTEMYSGRRDYMIALANHRFNFDDIETFKNLRVIGEDNRGFLHVFEDSAAKLTEADNSVLESVVAEENRGRGIIMSRVIELRTDLTDEDLPEIQRIFAGRNIEEEKPGRFIQDADDSWSIKE